jgi:hypothetical protein
MIKTRNIRLFQVRGLFRNKYLIILVLPSIFHASLRIQDLSVTSNAAEFYILISCFGISLFMLQTYEFGVAFVASLTGLILAAIANSLIVKLNVMPSVESEKIINSITICGGFTLSICAFYRNLYEKKLMWCVILHFILVGLLQKDQLGLEFNPYTFDNPIQWVVLLIFPLFWGMLHLFI